MKNHGVWGDVAAERIQQVIAFRQSKWKKAFATEKRDIVKAVVEECLKNKREAEIRAKIEAEAVIAAAAAEAAAAEAKAANQPKGLLGFFMWE